jgi:pimeloyl-ACP methyl ester carboxylesterase
MLGANTQNLNPARVIYLHGLGSSPASPKARLFLNHFAAKGHPTDAPNLAVPSLEKLSPTLAIERIVELLESLSESPTGEPLVVIASSLGAFFGCHSYMRLPKFVRAKVRCLVLLAPVIYPWDLETPIITSAIESSWAAAGSFKVEEGASGRMVPLHYDFLLELRELAKQQIVVDIPTLVVHGTRDDRVPYKHAVNFAKGSHSVRLVSFEDDHQLLADPWRLLQVVSDFID